MEAIYEGKAKKLYLTENPDELLMIFKDDATAFNGVKKAQFEDKGRINKALSQLLYGVLEKHGIPSHFVSDVDDISMIVKRVEIVAIELVVRNVVAGSLAKRTGLPEGTVVKTPVVEFYYKSDELGDPMINMDHVKLLDLGTESEVAEMCRQAKIINTVLTETFKQADLRLVDFKLEFGRPSEAPETVILADEISPDTCRLWDLESDEKMDKDRFRRDLGDVMKNYAEVLRRVEKVVNN